MTTLGSNIYPTTTGGEIVSVFVLLVGIGFVALLTGSFAQRFLAPEIAEIEEELEEEKLSAEALALRELKSVQEQLQALELAIERMAEPTSSPHTGDDASVAFACSSAIFASSSFITSGSRRVVTSPRARPSAMSRSSRRMILPERVFGRSSAQTIRFGRANLPIRSATVARMPVDQLVAFLDLAAEGDEGADRLAGVLVGLADHRRLGDVGVGDDRRLDLGGREPVAGDVDDVVDPADHPEVAVGVAAGGVADQVALLAEAGEVGLDEAVVLLVEAAQHRGPRALQHQQALAFVDRLALALVDHLRPRRRGTASSPSPAWSR